MDLAIARFHRFYQPVGIVIRTADRADLSLLDQTLVRLQRFCDGRVLVRKVREIEIDVVGLQTLQRRLAGALDIGRLEPLAGGHLAADLGDQHDLVAIASRLHPLADDGFRFTTLMPRCPARIDVSGVDGVEAGADEGVEHG